MLAGKLLLFQAFLTWLIMVMRHGNIFIGARSYLIIIILRILTWEKSFPNCDF